MRNVSRAYFVSCNTILENFFVFGVCTIFVFRSLFLDVSPSSLYHLRSVGIRCRSSHVCFGPPRVLPCQIDHCFRSCACHKCLGPLWTSRCANYMRQYPRKNRLGEYSAFDVARAHWRHSAVGCMSSSSYNAAWQREPTQVWSPLEGEGLFGSFVFSGSSDSQ